MVVVRPTGQDQVEIQKERRRQNLDQVEAKTT
jgi:hypothetical protein